MAKDVLQALGLENIRQTLCPGQGKGRPSNSLWTLTAKIPTTQSTKTLLERLAKTTGVGWTQIASCIIEVALAREVVQSYDAHQPINPECVRMPTYYRILMDAVEFDPSLKNIKSALVHYKTTDWKALLEDAAIGRSTIHTMLLNVHPESQTIPDFLEFLVKNAPRKAANAIQLARLSLVKIVTNAQEILDRVKAT